MLLSTEAVKILYGACSIKEMSMNWMNYLKGMINNDLVEWQISYPGKLILFLNRYNCRANGTLLMVLYDPYTDSLVEIRHR